ncbi:uncharacterized protein EAF02_001188 [Botrytis sinoallii]|uniref:uncharacterized protein n=1 Tax=Botrytis sinoallii TaxID=1463999 RepID=UPI00190096B8|nr:uncharacterized protein EAF02_001188 [Botrytis sinoallii]KAF7893650.1 hypothetical protein EAF02_001188 [Botrytis sinoallii]
MAFSKDVIDRFLSGDLGALGLSGPSESLPRLDDDQMKQFTSGDYGALGLPAPSSLPTPEKVRKEAKERSTEVLSHWNRLRQILERHEDVIRKRWMKKSKVHRSKIILQAWPGMSATHRPDFEALIKEGSQLKTKGTKYREAYLWPYLNVEDLVRGKTFLLLINSRGRHPPHVFAHTDFQATQLGRVSAATMPAFLNVHTMLLEGETVKTYGRLISWDEDEDAMMDTFAGLAHLPGSGLMILEIQQRLLHLLVKCCEALLHDIDSDSLISEASIKPEPPLLTDGSDWSTIAAVAAEAPYRLPSKLDFHRLQVIVEARRISAEDYIRDLREDPGYFAEVLGDWSEHRQEKLLDTFGNRHPTLDRPLFWEYVIGNVVSDAYGALIVWENVAQQLKHLAFLQKKYASKITPKKQLPPEYMKALLTLRYSLNQMAKGPIRNLKMAVPASPPYRSKFVRDPQVPGSTMIQVRSKGGQDEMMWLFNSLWNDQQLFLMTLPTLVDEIESRIERDPNEKAKFSALVARIFSDLGLISRIYHELDIYLPWAAGYDNALVEHKDQIEKEFPKQLSLLASVDRHLKATGLAKFGSPAEGRFHYPSDKRRNKQNTESMRKAEHNLDEFWQKMDEVYQRNTGQTLTQAVKHICTAVRPLERTPEWVEPMKVPKPKPQDSNGRDEVISIPQFDSEDTTKFIAPQPKSKPKTRGPAITTESSTTLAVAPATASTLTPGSQSTFKLKARAIKVFKILFWQPSLNDLPGEIPWADFLYAMTSTGFAAEKQYGSVWQFTPTKLNAERSIQFHEPHPSGKIAFRTARRMGRRLGRSYGWEGGMFVLE